jgi:hypothetical protein
MPMEPIMSRAISHGIAAMALLMAGAALAKLPPPPAPSEEAKAKAAEAAAKAAHAGKVDSYKLCQSMDKAAAAYFANAKKSGKDVKPAVATPACVDPGPFAAAAPAAVAPTAAAPAAAPAKPVKK